MGELPAAPGHQPRGELLEQQHERAVGTPGRLLEPDLAGAVAAQARARAGATRAPRRAARARRRAARGGAGRGRRPCRSRCSATGTTTSSASARAIASSFSCRPRWTAAQGGCSATLSARRRTSSAGSSVSWTQAIESSTSTCSKRSRAASSSVPATSAIRPWEHELASTTSGSRPPSVQRTDRVGDRRAPCARGRRRSPSSSTASRSSGRRRPSGIHSGPPGPRGDRDERLRQRPARRRPRGRCRRCG